MSRELGVQFAREGIRVNALCPGPVNTPLLQELFAKDAKRAQRRLVHVPMGRFAEPAEIAAAVAFLASDDSSFITASTFLVVGDQDFVRLDHAAEMLDLFPNCRLAVLPATRHTEVMQRTEELRALVGPFLS